MMIRHRIALFLLSKQQRPLLSISALKSSCFTKSSASFAAYLPHRIQLQPSRRSVKCRCLDSFSTTTSSLRQAGSVDAAVTSDATPLYQNNQQDKSSSSSSLETWVYTLPRLYVGPKPSLSSSQKQQFPSSHGLQEDAMIRLSPDKIHYITRVMRIQPIRHFHQESSAQRRPQLLRESGIRLFNGRDGEWLAQVVNLQAVDDEDGATGKRKRSKKQQDDEFIVARCQQQFRFQSGASSRLNPVDDEGDTKDASVTTTSPVSTAATISPLIWLYMTPLPKTRLKWLVEKMTELGVTGLAWISSDHTELSTWKECTTTYDKLVSIVVEAAEQCERLTLPQLTILSAPSSSPSTSSPSPSPSTVLKLLQDWCKPVEEGDTFTPFSSQPRILLIGRERQELQVPSLFAALQHYYAMPHSSSSVHIGLLIGPSGGWSRREVETMDQYESEYPHLVSSFSLGSIILRSETAALAALAVASAVPHDPSQAPTPRD